MDLVAATAELIAIPSESHHERALADLIEQRLRRSSWLEVTRIGDNVVARTGQNRAKRLILAGHTDTVPGQGNEEPVVIGDAVRGLGAADMKGDLAVLLALAESEAAPAVDVTYVFYAREEVAGIHSGLEEVFTARPDLVAGDAAIIGEPTSAEVEAGCQGTLRVRLTLAGKRAHTARAWMGRNAIHRLGPVLQALDSHVARQPRIEGLDFHEALQVVNVTGGVAGNVVPDEASLVVNFRFAPDRTEEAAVAYVRSVVDPYLEAEDAFELQELSPAAYPTTDHPLLTPLLSRHGCGVRSKLGWTDVARFSSRGIPAVNFGPGDPSLAHTSEEWVSGVELRRVREVLADLLKNGGAE